MTSPEYSLSPMSSSTGAIFWDVENVPLKLDLVQYLKGYCRYPITVKFAVANWHGSVAKLDQHFHQQGYQLIHVPQSKNAADAQILTLGASIRLTYPQVKEVIVVSRDAIFNYLHQTLQRQGINTYKVYQQSENIYLDNFTSDRDSLITKVPQCNPQSSIEEQIQNKIELTLAELTKKSTAQVTLSQLSNEFKNKYNKTISETLKSNKLPKSTLSFIKNKCVNKIKVKADNNQHFLSLKAA